MSKLKLNAKYLFLCFAMYFLLSKVYFLYINPISIGSNVIALNTHIFYNAKSFQYLPQSFHDWNHPGTPYYYLTNLISQLIGGLQIENLKKFLIFNHVFLYFVSILSLLYLTLIFKDKIGIKNLYIFYFIIFSFKTNLLSIENVDYTALQVPISFFLIIYTFKCLDQINYKNLILLSSILAFSISIIMAFIPFVVCSIIALILQLFYNKNKFINFLVFAFSGLIFFLLFNFPIIGRIPKIFYNVLFVREDTSFAISETLVLFKNSFLFLLNQNIFLFILIIFFLIIIFLNLISKTMEKDRPNENNSKLLFIFLLGIFFLYTFLVAGQEVDKNYLIQGVTLRNSYVYSSFILAGFIFLQNNNFYKKISSLILILSVFSFLYTNYDYIKKRQIYIDSLKTKHIIFTDEIKKFKDKNDSVLIYSDTGYGFEDFSILSRGNSVFAGEKFTSELLIKYPKLRYLRVHDIINDKFERLSSIQNYPIYEWVDQKLKKILPYNLYLVFSHKSFHLTGGSFTDPKRSKDLFIKKNSDDKINLIVFNDSHLLQNVNKQEFIKYLKEKTNLELVHSFQIKEDIWYIIY